METTVESAVDSKTSPSYVMGTASISLERSAYRLLSPFCTFASGTVSTSTTPSAFLSVKR